MFSLSLGNSSSKYFDYTTMRKSEAKRMFAGPFIARGLILTLTLAAVLLAGAVQHSSRPTLTVQRQIARNIRLPYRTLGPGWKKLP